MGGIVALIDPEDSSQRGDKDISTIWMSWKLPVVETPDPERSVTTVPCSHRTIPSSALQQSRRAIPHSGPPLALDSPRFFTFLQRFASSAPLNRFSNCLSSVMSQAGWWQVSPVFTLFYRLQALEGQGKYCNESGGMEVIQRAAAIEWMVHLFFSDKTDSRRH